MYTLAVRQEFQDGTIIDCYSPAKGYFVGNCTSGCTGGFEFQTDKHPHTYLHADGTWQPRAGYFPSFADALAAYAKHQPKN